MNELEGIPDSQLGPEKNPFLAAQEIVHSEFRNLVNWKQVGKLLGNICLVYTLCILDLFGQTAQLKSVVSHLKEGPVKDVPLRRQKEEKELGGNRTQDLMSSNDSWGVQLRNNLLDQELCQQ